MLLAMGMALPVTPPTGSWCGNKPATAGEGRDSVSLLSSSSFARVELTARLDILCRLTTVVPLRSDAVVVVAVGVGVDAVAAAEGDFDRVAVGAVAETVAVAVAAGKAEASSPLPLEWLSPSPLGGSA